MDFSMFIICNNCRFCVFNYEKINETYSLLEKIETSENNEL